MIKKARQVRVEEFQHTDECIVHEDVQSYRLNKFISSSGYCSRRDADRLIQDGKVTIDGEVAVMGTKVFKDQEVAVEGQLIPAIQKSIYIILHKPVGIICTGDTDITDNIISFMNYPHRIFPVGRLDRESSGLIILTNDGDVVNKILRSSYEHEKEYIVTINRYVTPTILENLQKGVEIYNPVKNAYQMTKPCKVIQEDASTFRIFLSEGLNRQIRRMCTALNCKVTSLRRIRIMNVVIDGLNSGDWRYLSSQEISILNDQLQHNSVK